MGVTRIVEGRDDESAERLLNRFRLAVQRSGVSRDAKRRRHFTSKSEARRRARARALRKNAAKAEARNNQRPRGARQR